MYGIEERYKGKLLGGDAKAWLVQVFEEWRWKEDITTSIGSTPEEYLEALSLHTQSSPFTDANFLKRSFLNGCKAAGLFNPLPPTILGSS